MNQTGNRSIFLYGQFDQSHLGASYQRAFENLGYRVIIVDERQIRQHLAPWLVNRFVFRLTRNNLQIRRFGSRQWNRYILDMFRTSKPDICLVLKGSLVMPETLRSIRQSGVPVILFHPDNPFPPFSNSFAETLPCAVETDCYLIWSRSIQQRLKLIPVRRAEYLPFAWDPVVYPHVPISQKPIYDLTFVGGWDIERETWLTPLARSFNLKIWGPDQWKTRTLPGSPLPKCWQGKVVVAHEAGEIYRQSRVVLNFLRKQNLPDGTNMRTFEVPGAGGFLVATRSSGAGEFFAEGHGGAFFETIEECTEQIAYFLHNSDKRTEIASNAHNIVSAQHQYIDRAHTILDIFADL